MVPNGWKKGLLDEGIELISGQHVEANCVNNLGVGIPYLTGPADFPNGKIVVTKFTNEGKKFSKKGDLLITVKGSGTGKVIESDNEYAISRQLMAIRPKTFDSKFVYYNLVSSLGRYEDAAAGLIPGISREDVLNTPLLIPQIDEQKAIAHILSTWDQALSATEKLLEKSQQQKKALMQQLLTGKKRLLDENGVRFSDEWQIGYLEDLCKLKGGSAFKEEYQGFKDGDIPFIKVSDMNLEGNEKYIIKSNNWIKTDISKIIKAVSFPVNSIVFAKVGAALLLNRRRILTRPTIIDNNMMAAIPNQLALSEFLYQLLLCIDFAKLVQDGAVPSVNQTDIGRVKIKYPLLKEQRAITKVLILADQEIDLLKQKLDCLKQEKKALMQQLLTGKKRVKVAA